jgi:hypothetical protein
VAGLPPENIAKNIAENIGENIGDNSGGLRDDNGDDNGGIRGFAECCQGGEPPDFHCRLDYDSCQNGIALNRPE